MEAINYIENKYPLPFKLREDQVNSINELAPLQRAGFYYDVGLGKTVLGIYSALYKIETEMVKHVICLMPPVLITNWSRNIARIPGTTHVCYRGTPAQRDQLDLNVQFILMSYQIFKKDWEKLAGQFHIGEVCLICDEAKAIKNVGSDTYKKVRDFASGNNIVLLEGTPINHPLDGYAYVKTLGPTIYSTLYQFEQVHVKSRDFFNKPTEFRNLDLLAENIRYNAVRLLKRDVIKDMPPVTYNEIIYDLNPKHLKLYQKIVAEQIAALPDDTKIDLTHASSLLHACCQLPCNAEHFSGGDVESTGLELLDEIMEELDGAKLIVFTVYRMTNKRLTDYCQKYGAVSIYGETAAKERQANLDRFTDDPSCRMIILQVRAAGAGIDGLQNVCSDVLFLELPYTPGEFHQAVGRADRVGQTQPVNVRIALAAKTVQSRVWDLVQEKDSLVNVCIRGQQDLKNYFMGT